MRYSSNPLAKRCHFDHAGGPYLNIVSSRKKTVLAFTRKNQERQTKLSQVSSLTLQELITDGHFESNACTMLKKPDFLFGDFINQDAAVIYDGNYKWLRLLE